MSISGLKPPWTCWLTLPADDRIAADSDGDGFYCRGMGPRPDNLAAYVPLQQGGDDSDADSGLIDEYGYCMDLNPETNAPMHRVMFVEDFVISRFAGRCRRGWPRTRPALLCHDGFVKNESMNHRGGWHGKNLPKK